MIDFFCHELFRGFKSTKRPNSETVTQAQNSSETLSTPTKDSGNKSLVFKNNFVNDGNFLEQFKRMKESTTSAKQEPVKIEPKIQVKPENDSKNSNDWYQAALERAKNIAKSMSKDVKSEGKKKTENLYQNFVKTPLFCIFRVNFINNVLFRILKSFRNTNL